MRDSGCVSAATVLFRGTDVYRWNTWNTFILKQVYTLGRCFAVLFRGTGVQVEHLEHFYKPGQAFVKTFYFLSFETWYPGSA